MMQVNPYQKYRQTQVNTATPQELILMLYDAGIKVLLEAKKTVEEKNIEQTHFSLTKGQEILQELQASLNEQAGEIAGQLGLLYDYMHRRLMAANLQKDGEIIDEVLGYFRDLRAVWQEAMRIAKTDRGQPVNG